MEETAIIATDGSAIPNPGTMAIGVLVFGEDKKLIDCVYKKIGRGTNNIAEYTALITGLKTAKIYGYKKVEINIDSELVYKQICGEYSTKSKGLKPLLEEFKREARGMCRVQLNWGARYNDYQRLADAVSKGKKFVKGEFFDDMIKTIGEESESTK